MEQILSGGVLGLGKQNQTNVPSRKHVAARLFNEHLTQGNQVWYIAQSHP